MKNFTVTVDCPVCEKSIKVTLCPYIPARGYDPPEGGNIEDWEGHKECKLDDLSAKEFDKWQDACFDQAGEDEQGAYEDAMERRYEEHKDRMLFGD